MLRGLAFGEHLTENWSLLACWATGLLGAWPAGPERALLRRQLRGANFGRSQELGQHRENPYIASSVWGIKTQKITTHTIFSPALHRMSLGIVSRLSSCQQLHTLQVRGVIERERATTWSESKVQLPRPTEQQPGLSIGHGLAFCDVLPAQYPGPPGEDCQA